MKFNKGAMFGLDARIALAIFGALSVISGAALYSAIQKAKTEQYRQYFVELGKASEAYYLDTGIQLNINDVNYLALIVGDLLKNVSNVSSWKGPYWSADFIHNAYFKDSFTNKLHSSSRAEIWLRQVSDWTEMNDSLSDEFCAVDSSDCAEWIMLSAIDSSVTSSLQSIFKMLDEEIDNSDGALKGTVRYNTHNNGYIMYQGRFRKRLN